MPEIRQPTVAIVEDDEILAFMLDETCKSAGCRVIGRVGNARDALRLLHNASPDFLILDFALDGKQDGLNVLEAVKETSPEMFTILVTGWDLNDIAGRIDGIQPDQILRKPVMPHVLIDLIEKSFAAKQDRRDQEEGLIGVR
ncbi:response regulator [Erythrobacter sp. SD-21]|uniref:response regulator n=1 Tax=Erythrobacter sp. SD-21 TaxID=161528 RepID=UPI000153F977|nr:response regulator [Erythrobacter sp. SD-21]EDL49104.1 two component, sigma54 specific, transcriptional regulator, Fis family protein [Erythrobacter sp. SD-21]